MRRTLVALSTVAALISGSLLFGSTRADAMITAAPLGHPGQSMSPVEKTACWRLGWRGWGLSSCGYYYGGYPYYPGRYGYGYPYGWFGGYPYYGYGGYSYYGYGWGSYWGY